MTSAGHLQPLPVPGPANGHTSRAAARAPLSHKFIDLFGSGVEQ